MPHDALSRSPLLGWLAVVSVAMGIFAIVTAEILPIGLLTSIGSTFGISDGTAGLTMTMPGVLAAVSAPVVTVAVGRLDRRMLLCGLMLLLAVANVLAATATSYPVVVTSRALVGVVIGGFWSIGAGLAARLVRPERVGVATAVIFSAVPLGSVFGVPAGTFIAQFGGWRTAFVMLGALTVIVLVALVAVLPPLPAAQPVRLAALVDLVRGRTGRTALVLTVLVVTAHFGTYTYVTPFLQQVTGVGSVTPFLLVFGIAGVVGNFVAGTTVRHRLRVTLIASAAALASATVLLLVFGTEPSGATMLLVLWGLAYGAVPVCSQSWFTAAAAGVTEAASVLFTSSFQATIALGAVLGGVVVDASSPSMLMVLGSGVALLAVLGATRSMSPQESVSP
ncbi:MFS transporter [Micromonospora peucetia]|uniref:MFS transporter n=1 Tax=Micromonospora peucetia TaxID=47871 RepID=A0A1C6VYX7_9ACTN|nr:MFS transporter [Micromonospora peucetia]WSA31652.1 MFS transporter [Micromonospora peucetia]SCL71551.1 Predicted arabinose efflux permease, MFS family [Micromonospora peucetia]